MPVYRWCESLSTSILRLAKFVRAPELPTAGALIGVFCGRVQPLLAALHYMSFEAGALLESLRNIQDAEHLAGAPA
jgi:hypothetical protein